LIAGLGLPFVTVDVACRTDQVWRVIELGDGHVSDRPVTTPPSALMATIQGSCGASPARKPRARRWVGAYPVPVRPTASKVNSMVRRSPQEKKALSYTKDRRNVYGENDKSSRKNIRRKKRIPNRADRHREHRLLSTATGPTAAEAAQRVEDRLLAKKSMWLTRRWRKWRDAPLAEIVADKLRRRGRLGMDDPAAVDARIERIRSRTK
jgi:hypothetical protein